MSTNQTQFIYTLQAKRAAMLSAGPTTKEASTLRNHLKYLERLAEQGIVLLAGRTQTTDENTFGIVILRADSETTARDIMADDPAILDGVMDGRLYPYRIAITSPSILGVETRDA